MTDSGTVVELQAPSVEYCKIQELEALVAMLKKHDLPFIGRLSDFLFMGLYL